ncbi:ATP-binding cassette domain-containing protein [Micromonospora sp. WMMD964]|uniref:ATP-binding cassette domain-containing protein n=1 Tax=Micromonospora sp. WMMD964 TaxID=3016091 RepID=UPI00249AB8B2|nr:ATP-binding cassette domain-containing protein [Micromonospora sp. WMMD964]WFE99340.1 ATP-binding cassette domain-containing protein [Micromonospora sp. WMMD964]
MTHPGVRQVTWQALQARRRDLARLGGWSLVEAVPALLSGYLVARAVDDGFLAGRPATGLTWLGALAAAVLIGAAATGRTYRRLGAVVEPFRDDLATRMVRGALHDATRTGAHPDNAALARLTHQLEIVRDTFAGLLMVTRGFLFSAGAALLGLLALAPVTAALAAAPLAAGLAVFLAALPAMITHQRAYVRTGEHLSHSAATALTAHRDVLACGAQTRVTTDVEHQVTAQATAERTLARMAAVRSLSLGIGGWLPLIVLLIATPWLIERGLTAGAVLGALIYISTGLQPALHTLLQGIGGGGLRYLVTLENILRTYPPPDTPHPTRPHPRPTADPAPAVEIRNLTFRYGPHARPVLDDLTLTLHHGDHLAVVGPSGTGKSTLAALIAGLLPPQTGTVHLAGHPVTGTDPATLARRRVLVPQEAYIFTGRLADNLRYLRPDADDHTLHTAIDTLGARPLATRLGGLDAPITPTQLSSGERQLVAAVRAWLAPAPLVILDEATCHLDPTLEATVEDAFAQRPGTLVVIAHRISSAMRAHRLLVLDGTETLTGTHEHVLEHSTAYRLLVDHWHQHTTAPVTTPTPPG